MLTPPSASRTLPPTWIGPAVASHVAVFDGLNAPNPFPQSNAYVNVPPADDGSATFVSDSWNVPSAGTFAGALNVAVGGAFSTVNRVTCGSWSDAWSANSAFTCTGWYWNGPLKRCGLMSVWSSTS